MIAPVQQDKEFIAYRIEFADDDDHMQMNVTHDDFLAYFRKSCVKRLAILTISLVVAIGIQWPFFGIAIPIGPALCILLGGVFGVCFAIDVLRRTAKSTYEAIHHARREENSKVYGP